MVYLIPRVAMHSIARHPLCKAVLITTVGLRRTSHVGYAWILQRQHLLNCANNRQWTDISNPSLLSPHLNSTAKQPKRGLWWWLNAIFNMVSKDRIREVGPDRACVEWLMRCGAFVKFKDYERWQTDYNSLPGGGFEKYKIEKIDATDSAVMSVGFPHLDGCKHVKWIRLKSARSVNDEAMQQLHYVKDTLEHLEVVSCGNVSDKGLMALQQFKNLKYLLLYDLPEVKDKKGCLRILQDALQGCVIEYPENIVRGERQKEKEERGSQNQE
ncbi:PREDICTED: ATP synthase subunit s, mitochondrial-like [Priapulus caudatus]|uniref:ATP synthase subunit s, mitochondrial-like n=1 Tax=Priapulus caudatus TaxID=37621 RepID=A0ABM1F0J9_PRICU|nr:PREDICTED: ATP synthase subunit s, mitochondrial-like [Priapulus caudatus]